MVEERVVGKSISFQNVIRLGVKYVRLALHRSYRFQCLFRRHTHQAQSGNQVGAVKSLHVSSDELATLPGDNVAARFRLGH